MSRRLERLRSLLGGASGAGFERLLAKLSGGAFVLEIGGAGAAFLVQAILSRVMGAEGVGVYLICLSWVRLLALPAKLGMERASLRFIASFEATGQLGQLRGYMRRSHQLVFCASALFGLGLFVVTRLLADRIQPALSTAFIWASIALPLISFVGLHAATLRGFKKIAWALGAQKVLKPLLMLGLVVGALTLGDGLTAPRAVALQTTALGLTLVATSFAIRRARPAGLSAVPAEYETREWLSVSMPLLLITGFNIVLRQTDIIMVGSLLGSSQAGIYGGAARISTLIHFGLNAVNAGLAPIISQLHSQGKHKELQGVIGLAARLIFLFTLVVSAAVIFGAGFVLSIYGPEFLAGTTALRILIFSQLVNSLAGPVGLLMTMTGHQNEAARVIGGSAALNIVLNVALIPVWGIVGAAIATTIATVTWNVILVVKVRRRLEINSLVQW